LLLYSPNRSLLRSSRIAFDADEVPSRSRLTQSLLWLRPSSSALYAHIPMAMADVVVGQSRQSLWILWILDPPLHLFFLCLAGLCASRSSFCGC
jgi:hypothetical protein